MEARATVASIELAHTIELGRNCRPHSWQARREPIPGGPRSRCVMRAEAVRTAIRRCRSLTSRHNAALVVPQLAAQQPWARTRTKPQPTLAEHCRVPSCAGGADEAESCAQRAWRFIGQTQQACASINARPLATPDSGSGSALKCPISSRLGTSLPAGDAAIMFTAEYSCRLRRLS